MKSISLKFVLVLLAVFMLQFNHASAASAKSTLNVGETLAKGQMLSSPSGRFNLVMQNDGNLVLYRDAGIPMWDTNTDGDVFRYYDTFLGREFQRYPEALTLLPNTLRVTDPSKGIAFWTADVKGWSNAHYKGNVPAGLIGDSLVVQDDGNVVLYATGKGPVWASNTGGY
ncbi:hypothetical protein QCD85_01165 [Paenibacillus sp. PsM32]|uniref:hypothetical protein n=1 Tax=unclassified Paenibacillus TaxID=185978 RepID=UPI00263AAD41|nr:MULTISPECIES: hypothetical protein [unclassified Paenibacillus]MDN4616687.1 hypothetical protein [Paenibacillus sp. PsM32]MDQ1233527.1 hypothetical protein [Paenibacillus sp. SORGH_AS_0306]MDR6110568.1 hypothetical protein [Paenibacillus sp. SORGH_AS_0338]